jgi:hypothetical protein
MKLPRVLNKFLDVTDAEYHADQIGLKVPSLNYSTAKVILARSPLHAWIEHPRGGGQTRPAKKQMDFGSILHSILLSKGAKAQIIDTVYGPKHKKAGQQVEDYKTDAAQAARDEAHANGFIPLLPKEYERAMAAATSITVQLEKKGITLGGHTEQAFAWVEDGVQCRGKADHVQMPKIDELKMTDWPLTESSLRRLIRNCGYDLQAATYTAGVHTVTGEMPEFRWIFAEMNPPYQIRIVKPTDLLLQVGRHKWDKAREAWKKCLESGVWTAYGDDELELDPEFWELRQHEISVYQTPEIIGEVYADDPDDNEMWF